MLPAESEAVWRGILMGSDARYRRARGLFKHFPGTPRCKLCAAPFVGPFAPLMRARGRSRWAKNPKYCGVCYGMLEQVQGGAEIPCTLMFADMRGSTSLAERVGATEFKRLLSGFYETAGRVLVAHDGIVDKFVGDEVMAIFIPALAQERHAARAIDAATTLIRETQAAGLPIGAGVHTGDAFVGGVGEPPITEFTALGDVVNTAARLASAAGAGEVLVSVDAARSAGLEIAALEHRSLELRGKSLPTEVVVVRP
jgi:adenylate cyclase